MLSGLFNAANRFWASDRNYQHSRYSTTELIGNPTPVWVDTSNLWLLYGEIGELKSVINRYSNMVASAHPTLCDADGEPMDLPNHWMTQLLNRPNSLQSWNSMILMTSINKCVTANALIFSPAGSMGNRQNLTPLAYNDVQIKATGASLRQTAIDGIIEEFKVKKDAYGAYEIFKPSEIVYLNDVDGINLFDTTSRIVGLRDPLSNIAAGYRKRNVLLTNLFSLGILTGKANSDGVSAIPLDPEDAEKMREDMKKRHEGQVIVTDKDFKFEAMSFPVKELQLFEEMTEDKLAIIDAYGLNQHMFTQGTTSRGSTFSNVEMGERQAYNSTIIPDTVLMYKEIGFQLGLEKEGIYLKPSFEHISVLKADETKSAEAMFKRAQAVEKMSEQVTLSDEERRALLKI